MNKTQIKQLKSEIKNILLKHYIIVDKEWNISFKSNISIRTYMKSLAELKNPKPIESVMTYFANDLAEIDINKISPKLIQVTTNEHKNIFKTAQSYWSVPVTQGYGRRINLIIFDEYHNKVMGILGLCDPVIGINVRDKYIGWDKDTKFDRLYNIMSAYVLGAIYPYNLLYGAKLVALIAQSNEIREIFKKKYQDKSTIIRNEVKIPELVAIDTMGAFGQSAIYHQLKKWKFLGYTQGFTHYHLTTNGIFDIFLKIVKDLDKECLKKNQYGNGANWKMRIIREACNVIGINPDKLMFHGIQRAYYICPLAKNYNDFLNKNTDEIDFYDMTFINAVEKWKNKWLKKYQKKNALVKGDALHA